MPWPFHNVPLIQIEEDETDESDAQKQCELHRGTQKAEHKQTSYEALEQTFPIQGRRCLRGE